MPIYGPPQSPTARGANCPARRSPLSNPRQTAALNPPTPEALAPACAHTLQPRQGRHHASFTVPRSRPPPVAQTVQLAAPSPQQSPPNLRSQPTHTRGAGASLRAHSPAPPGATPCPFTVPPSRPPPVAQTVQLAAPPSAIPAKPPLSTHPHQRRWRQPARTLSSPARGDTMPIHGPPQVRDPLRKLESPSRTFLPRRRNPKGKRLLGGNLDRVMSLPKAGYPVRRRQFEPDGAQSRKRTLQHKRRRGGRGRYGHRGREHAGGDQQPRAENLRPGLPTLRHGTRIPHPNISTIRAVTRFLERSPDWIQRSYPMQEV